MARKNKKNKNAAGLIEEPDAETKSEQTEEFDTKSEVYESKPESSDMSTEEPDIPKGIRKLRKNHYVEGQDKPRPSGGSRLPPFGLNFRWHGSWLEKNWKPILLLMVIFSFALYIRSYYGVEPATEDGFLLSGGSDSYYHHFVITNAQETGDHHFWDDMLDYPLGTRNPRPPLYDWSVYMGGIALTPFFGGDIIESTWWVFIFSTAFWGALTIFPTYLLAKEAFGRKTGYIAAFLLAVMPGHIQRSVLTNADHDAFALFFIVLTFYFFLKALKGLKEKTWVKEWTKMDEVKTGFMDMIMNSRSSIIYAALAAMSLSAVALTWKGWAYVIVILTVYLGIQLLLDRFRNVDSLGVLMVYFFTVGIALVVIYPYYYLSIQIISWYDTPAYIFLGALVVGVILVVTRKLPWLLVIGGSLFLLLVGILILSLVAPATIESLTGAVASGAGYFVRNKQYETIAEAQAPPFSNLALSFGVITFWLSFAGVAWAAYQLPKRMKFDYIFVLIWTATSIYMATNAARFMFNAAPVFAITAAWITALIIEKLNIKEFVETQKRLISAPMHRNFKLGLIGGLALLAATVAGLSSDTGIALAILVIGLLGLAAVVLMNTIAEINPGRTSYLLALLIPVVGALVYMYGFVIGNWEFTTATHLFILGTLLLTDFLLLLIVRKSKVSFVIGVLFLAFFIILPNVWTGIDAGIPYETKRTYDKQIYDVMPLFLQPESYDATNGSNWFLGAFGYSLPLNSKYYPAAYDWLATQDQDIYPPEDRPAYLSWWDYGFEAVNEGKHPTVADNFLGGHQLAGNFIMSQSEADAIALLVVRIIEAEWRGDYSNTDISIGPEMLAILESYGLDTDEISNMLSNPSDYYKTIWANPDVYGPRDEIIQTANGRYLAVRGEITQKLSLEEIVSLYNDVRALTGDSIRYFAIDSRLFPFSAQNTGIFYAPAKLSDHRMTSGDEGNQPYDFWQIKAVDEYGGEYDIGEVPPDVKLDPNNPYKLEYQEMFYNSMLYKAFIGYSGEDIGQSNEDGGIPAISSSMTQTPIMPAWNMTHFKLVHRTAYWNPYGMEDIQNHTDAWRAMNFWDAYENQLNDNGISDLSDKSSLYQGVMMLKYYDGAIVSGHLTLEDGTPIVGAHMTVHDDFDIPHQRVKTDEKGEYSLIVPFGDIKITASFGAPNLLTMIGTEMNTTEMFIEDYQAMREKVDWDGDGRYDYLINHDITIPPSSVEGLVYWDTEEDGVYSDTDDILIEGAEITVTSKVLDASMTAYSDEDGVCLIEGFVPGDAVIDIAVAGRQLKSFNQTFNPEQKSETSWALEPTFLLGSVLGVGNEPVEGATVEMWIEDEEVQETISGVNGTFRFTNLLHGDYLIQAIYEDQACPVSNVRIKHMQNNTITLRMEEAVQFTGYILLPNGSPAKQASIRMTYGDEAESDVLLVANKTGAFRNHLPEGVYIAYCSYPVDGKEYVHASRIELFSDTTMDLNMVEGVRVAGVLSGADISQPINNLPVIFTSLDDEFILTAISSNQGTFVINLPEGSYELYSSVTYSPDEFVYSARHYFGGTQKEISIDLEKAFHSTMSIYQDYNGDGEFQTEEGLPNVIINYITDGGQIITSITDSLGGSDRALYKDEHYTVEMEKEGYYPASLGRMSSSELDSSDIRQEMVPELVPVEGSILMDDEILTGENAYIDFIAISEGAVNTSVQMEMTGSYHIELPPGQYTVDIQKNITLGNDTEILQIDHQFTFDTGFYSGSAMELNLTVMHRVKFFTSLLRDGTLSTGNMSFLGDDYIIAAIETGQTELYIKPGEYIVRAHYAQGEDIYLANVIENISALSIVDVTLDTAYNLTGHISYELNIFQGRDIIFTDLETNDMIVAMTDENSDYSIQLVRNKQYRIDMDFVDQTDMAGTAKTFRYYINAENSITNETIFTAGIGSVRNQDLQREEYFIDLEGNITLATTTADPVGTELTFRSKKDIFKTVSDPSGYYEIAIPPGLYTVYAFNPETEDAYIETIELGMFKRIVLDLTLEEGHGLSGEVFFNDNQHQMITLEFTSIRGMMNLTTTEDGHYSIWLPEGSYNITGELTVYDEANEIDIEYTLYTSIELTDDTRRSLPLDRVEVLSISLESRPLFTGAISPVQTVEHEITLKNLGNTPDTYSLQITGGSPSWATAIDKTRIELGYGAGTNEAKIMSVFTVPEGTLVNYNPITVIATSTKDPSVKMSTTLELEVKQTRALELNYSATSLVMDSQSMKWSFDVMNTGNGDDEVTVYIANLDEMRAKGWDVTIDNMTAGDMGDGQAEVMNLTVTANNRVTIPLTFRQIGDSPARNVALLIGTFSQADKSVYTSKSFAVTYPDIMLDQGNITISGGMVYESSTEDPFIGALVTIIAVTFGLVMFYVMKKKRWLR